MIIVLLILSVLLGVLLGKILGNRAHLAKNLLVLSAGFLITICVNEVFPEIYQSAEGHHIGIWVIAGVLLQMILESLTKGFEHGHMHHHESKNILPMALMVGMFIHAFIEGIPLANEHDIFSAYLMGIVFHNLPISFVLGAYLFSGQSSRRYAWTIISLFALASPLGMVLGQYFNPAWQPYFLAIVGGIFLHISSVIIFESNKNHKMDWIKLALVSIGVALALLGHLFHHH
ncbi:ZIP family metal transporter [Riemerella columbina]|uniref:ZIP family metal transporter n=1 Tax=Riemerella columbina TaxID=103810 RepID=UPI00266EA3E2|nr:ZIP family metal transporter [Riemerella columbina]WKS94341.1 ZIP family metal transporter [Riemerella columbina]